MSRHEGVSCDSCLKGNFRGKRYKCLICYDYDLCSTCYEAGATTTRHTTEHPMQCILTRTDFDLYYGGEALTTEQPQSFTCPYCGKMGFPEATLHDHVTSEHADASVEVVCPVCAALPGGDPNHVTDDFASHLTLEHRSPRDFDEPAAGMRHVRRIPHPGRGVSGSRTRRANMHFASTGTALTGLSPSGRETMDPIAELLSQLSSVRSRAAAAQSVSSQLQQLEMQLQSTRNSQQISSWCYNRQQLERLPRRQTEAAKVALPANAQNNGGEHGNSSGANSQSNSLYLLVKCSDELYESESKPEPERSDRSMFVQELLLSTLTDQIHAHEDDPALLLEALKSPASEEVRAAEAKPCDEKKPSSIPQSKSVTSSCPPPASTAKLESRPAGGGGGGGGTQSTRPVSSNSSVGSGAAASTRQHVGGTSSQGGGGGGGTRQVYNALSNPPPLSPNVSTGGSASGSSMREMPPRAGAGHSGRDPRDPRMNPAAAKRNLLKHMPPPRASDTEPPPH